MPERYLSKLLRVGGAVAYGAHLHPGDKRQGQKEEAEWRLLLSSRGWGRMCHKLVRLSAKGGAATVEWQPPLSEGATLCLPAT